MNNSKEESNAKNYKLYINTKNKIREKYELNIKIENNNILFEIIKENSTYMVEYNLYEINKILNFSKNMTIREILIFLNEAIFSKKIKIHISKDNENIILSFKDENKRRIILKKIDYYENILNLIFLEKKNIAKDKSFLQKKRSLNNNDNDNNILYCESGIPKFKHKKDVYLKNDSLGINNIFEVYNSKKDGLFYLLCLNYNNFEIDVLKLENYSLINSLKGHNNHIISIRYFYNKKKTIDEYIISTDESNILIVWEINLNFNKKYIINTEYIYECYSCLLLFNINISDNLSNEKNIIISSTCCKSNSNQISSSKIYSLKTGTFIKYIFKTNNNNTYYILYWFNKQNKEYYIIELCKSKIVIINIFKEEIYSELFIDNNAVYYNGYINKINEIDYLIFCGTSWGVGILDLYQKNYNFIVNNPRCCFCNLIKWSSKYIIVTDYKNKSMKIVDLNQKKIITDIKNNKNYEIKYIKKIKDYFYGDAILVLSMDNIINLWSN